MENFGFMSFMYDMKRTLNIPEVANFDGIESVRDAFNNYGAGRVVGYFANKKYTAMRLVIVINASKSDVVAMFDNTVVISVEGWFNVEAFIGVLKQHIRTAEISNKGCDVTFKF